MTVSVQRGNPADVILAHGNSPKIRPADLIVLGAPRRRGIERLWGSSVAHAVVHEADCPHVIIPAKRGLAICFVASPPSAPGFRQSKRSAVGTTTEFAAA